MTTKKEKQLNETYQKYTEALVKSMHIDSLEEFIVDDIMGYGTAIDEKIFSLTDFQKVIERTKEQSAGLDMTFELTPVFRRISSDENTAIFVENLKIIMLINTEKQELFARVTSVLEYIDNRWMAVHVHASIPPENSENDAWHVEEWQRKNEKLQKLVNEKTTDLEQKNRNLEIEAALERVRARAMTMQSSNELSELVDTVFKELTKLDFALSWCMINIIDESSLSNMVWAANPNIDKAPDSYHMKFEDYPFHDAMMKGYKERATKFIYVLEGTEKKVYDEYLFNETEFRKVPEEAQTASRAMNKYVCSFTFSNFGGLQTVGEEPLSDANLDILARFGKVFDLTYTRFNDLKQAEAQAREAQIELALERVRAKALAMHKSEDILGVVIVLRQELLALEIEGVTAATIYLKQDDGRIRVWDLTEAIDIPDGEHLTFDFVFALEETDPKLWVNRIWSSGEHYFIVEMDSDDFERCIDWLRNVYPSNVEGFIEFIRSTNLQHVWLPCVPIVNGNGRLNIDFIVPPPVEMESILPRLGSAFDLAYKRFEDLQQAEAQAREAKIEAALERVRSRTMGMQKSEELKEVIQVVYEQFVQLDIFIEHAGFIMDYKARDDMHIWLADRSEVPSEVTIPYFDSPHWNSFNEAKEKGMDFFANHLTFEEKNKFYQDLFKLIPGVPEETKEFYQSCPGLAGSTVLLENVGLYIENFSGIPYSDEENNTLMRFGKVFQQTYTRFLDLQKAEEQAREAQIETALEKVRSRSLAMHKSDELSEVILEVQRKFQELDISMESRVAVIVVFDKNSRDFNQWVASPDFSNIYISTPYFHNPILDDFWTAKEGGVDFYSKAYSLEVKNSYFNFFFENSIYENVEGLEEQKKWLFEQEFYSYSPAFEKNSSIGIADFSGKSLNESDIEIIKRFAKVFEQAYVRFMDLQKAEAQAREAKIETALEKVRSRTMAMQRSDELAETSFLLFQQFAELGIVPNRFFIGIVNEEEGIIDLWITEWGGTLYSQSFKGNLEEPLMWKKVYEAWKAHHKSIVVDIHGEDLVKWNDYLKGIGFPVASRKLVSRIVNSCAIFSKGIISITTPEITETETVQLLERFASVFDGTYTRFIDLKNAEEQTREAQIEVALERVRSKAMAMHKSEELRDVIACIFQQLQDLGFAVPACSLVIYQEDLSAKHWFAGYSLDSYPESYTIPYVDIPYYTDLLEAWQRRSNYEEFIMEGQAKVDYAKWLLEHSEFKNLPKEFIEQSGMLTPSPMYFADAYMRYGMVELIGNESLSDEKAAVLKRISEVFEQTYTRFLDLQKAESQAKEAQIEAALERVRSRTMAMYDSNDLLEAVAVFFQQFKSLGLLPSEARTYFCHINTDTHTAKVWMTHLDGKVMEGSHITPLDKSPSMLNYYEAWKNKEPFIIRNYSGEALADYMQFLSTLPHVSKDEGYQHIFKVPPERIVMTDANFLQGNIGVMTFEPLSQEALDTLVRFAKVFELTYTRFLDLQKAEEQAREANIEAALERVRAASMAMHKSDELLNVIKVVSKQLVDLDFKFDNVSFGQNNQKHDYNFWLSIPYHPEPIQIRVPFFDNPVINSLIEAQKNKISFLTNTFSPKENKAWFQNVMKHGNLTFLSKEAITHIQKSSFTRSSAILKHVQLFVGRYSEKPFTKSENKIIARFAKVFEQAYVRFLDIQKAEEQARESQIETALERVRSRTMAMQRSDELAETASILFKQLIILGIEPNRLYITIIKDESGNAEFWITDEDGSKVSTGFTANLLDNASFKKMFEGWKEQIKSIIIDMQGKELQEYFQHLRKINVPFKGGLSQKRRVQSIAYFSQGFIGIASPEPQPEETTELLERFAAVFNLTYTRFNDLQQAEAQNKIIQAENERKSKELEEARQLQLAMLPKELPNLPNLDIAVYMQTATEVGGDYYDFQVGLDGTLTTIIGDATGHGMKAGTVVTITKSLFNSMAASENILDTFDKISQVIKGMKFRQLAMCLIMMKIKGNRLSISSAAMPPALIYRQKNKSVEEIFLKGMPLGTMMKFPYKKIESHLNSGDRILLYSDGLPELANDKSEMYGYDRIKTEFHSVGEKEPEEIVNHLKNSASQWANGKTPDDDVTFVVLKMK